MIRFLVNTLEGRRFIVTAMTEFHARQQITNPKGYRKSGEWKNEDSLCVSTIAPLIKTRNTQP